MKKNLGIIIVCFMILMCLPVTAHAEWEKIKFGEYPQSQVTDELMAEKLSSLSPDANSVVSFEGERYKKKDNEKWYKFEPIDWIILDKTSDGRTLVMSERILDTCGLNEKWEDSEARKWLHETFYNTAFDEQEKNCIYTSEIVTGEDRKTSDKLFYPTENDLRNEKYGFTDNNSRTAQETAYADAGECYLTRDTWSSFWLYVIGVYAWDGSIQSTFADVWWGARPCMNIDLSQATDVEARKQEEREKARVRDISAASVKLSKTSYKYDGKAKKPTVTVTYDGKKLDASDYKVEYKNNKYVGTASVTVTGQGQYKGSITKDFKIKSPGKITVKFNANGGKVSKKSKKVSRGSKYGELPKPTRKAYEFSGWYTSKTKGKKITEKSYVEASKTQTLYARWKIKTYKITYHYDGGFKIGDKDNPSTYTSKDKIVFAAPAKAGYIFKGWYTDKKLTKKITQIRKGTTGNKTLYSKWQPITYEVSYEMNGASGKKMSDSKNLKYDKSFKLKANSYKRKGYSFIGWSTTEKGSVLYADKQKVKNLTTMQKGKVKLYAQWKINEYEITYKSNIEGMDNSQNPTHYTINQKIKLKKPKIAGYIFEGWYSSSKYTKKADTTIPKGSTGKRSFYAKFKPITYTIQFSGNGLFQNMPGDIVCEYGKEYTLPGISEKDFFCWNTQADGRGQDYFAGNMIKNLTEENTATIILYTIVNRHKTLSINWSDINDVGSQPPKSDACGCYAMAYCRTILDNKVHQWSEYDANGGQNPYNSSADWNKANYNMASASSETVVYKAAYDSINNNKPFVVRVKGPRSSAGHYITIVGYANVTKNDSLNANNFLIIDSASRDQKSTTESMGAVGYYLCWEDNWSSGDGYHYVYTN